MLLAAAVIMQAILIWGIAPTLFLGFATKDDAAMLHTGQTGIERKLDDVAASITADILFGQITEYYRNKCIAKRDGNTREEQLYDTLLAGALVKYQIVMKGVHYPLAPC